MRRFRLGKWDGVVFEEKTCAFLVYFTGGDVQNESIESSFVGLDHVAVFHQKNTGGNDGDPLVAIDKGVIACESKEISCSKFTRIVCTITRFVYRSVQSGFEYAFITQAMNAAKTLYLHDM